MLKAYVFLAHKEQLRGLTLSKNLGANRDDLDLGEGAVRWRLQSLRIKGERGGPTVVVCSEDRGSSWRWLLRSLTWVEGEYKSVSVSLFFSSILTSTIFCQKSLFLNLGQIPSFPYIFRYLKPIQLLTPSY